MSETQKPMLVLGIDTCGPAGSVALARLSGGGLELLGESAIEGRTYSATLIASIDQLLKANGVALSSIGCIVVVSGPGSFTGVRIGLSAAKGLAEGADLKVVAVSRLEVLARKADVPDAALDAHRHEVFLLANGGELLAGAADFAGVDPAPVRIAVCDDAAAALIAAAWPGTELLRVGPPTAGDAISVALPRIQAGDFADVLLLDGHYLRRSDAEIFGDPANAGARR
ncbi:tRNA (adenosine(37)-N6)-threonylcarbamoyltransferase complex dimerization subunit type 1 TsaB [Occallatibacter riparius]|uniref:tRNA (Adenosine(37)-N6)-threonylcarbamoyltransferase complex dimerization subunit type 1 TsaB n=1 Tax=Occallatibacter riparius TaxID=1002689 RepID=A0A9J7BVP4_9BACT|nr:tRNA (adenosine(37)-N6)-threonylcarbamoyltransferase complex dimerization subunit type 1 TsaB [Occallatibacter riparius]UWZ86767.1 tRNA (adenosine(37)-N6)-threonylcarbamoyltransferase complex dimerization subunit type 1 TsaB [Occallatibacter riparius]